MAKSEEDSPQLQRLNEFSVALRLRNPDIAKGQEDCLNFTQDLRQSGRTSVVLVERQVFDTATGNGFIGFEVSWYQPKDTIHGKRGHRKLMVGYGTDTTEHRIYAVGSFGPIEVQEVLGEDATPLVDHRRPLRAKLWQTEQWCDSLPKERNTSSSGFDVSGTVLKRWSRVKPRV